MSINDSEMTKKENFNSITSFLSVSGYEHRIFDLSRRVVALSNEQFAEAEDQQVTYPVPFKQQAWLGLLFWHADRKQEAVIWFLKFPIDELGYLDLAARDGFLNQLINQLGENLVSQQKGQDLTDTLKESPYAFKPAQDKMAMFHAIATQTLNQPASQYYEMTLDYINGIHGYERWHNLGLQGIADVVARLRSNKHSKSLAKAIPKLPEDPLVIIAQMLEHTAPSERLTKALSQRLQLESQQDKPNAELLAALVRGLSVAEPRTMRNEAYLQLLGTKAGEHIEVLAAIVGRGWLALQHEPLMNRYLDVLAGQDQMVFNTLLDEIMLLEGMRNHVMTGFRCEKRSDALSEKIAGYMGRFRH